MKKHWRWRRQEDRPVSYPGIERNERNCFKNNQLRILWTRTTAGKEKKELKEKRKEERGEQSISYCANSGGKTTEKSKEIKSKLRGGGKTIRGRLLTRTRPHFGGFRHLERVSPRIPKTEGKGRGAVQEERKKTTLRETTCVKRNPGLRTKAVGGNVKNLQSRGSCIVLMRETNLSLHQQQSFQSVEKRGEDETTLDSYRLVSVNT